MTGCPRCNYTGRVRQDRPSCAEPGNYAIVTCGCVPRDPPEIGPTSDDLKYAAIERMAARDAQMDEVTE